MKRLAALLMAAVAAGCSSSSSPQQPPANSPDELRFEMGVASLIAYDVTKLKRGEKAIYSIKLLGSSKTDYVKNAVVDDDATSIWIENTVPGDPRPFIFKSRYERKTGKLLETWAGEPGTSKPAKYYPRKGETKENPLPQRDSSGAQPQFKEEADQIMVGGKTWDATKVTTTLSYPDGRKSVLTDWYHKDVPFSVVIKTGTPNEKSYGGLVRRQFGRLTMELVAWDTKGATPELEIPR
jgi:hypothetical protein